MTLNFTIVTPTFNRRDMLVKAIDSVTSQDWPTVEHIVVDGGSTDGTAEWLADHRRIKFVSGPDDGVYDAVNKGIALAEGDIIGILNSDDWYCSGAFRRAAGLFEDHSEIEVVSGRALLVSESGSAEELGEPGEYPQAVRAALMGVCLPNARFFRRGIFKKVGMFDPSLRLIADRDFILRLLEQHIPTASVDEPLYAYRRHAGSLTFDPARSQALTLRSELLKLAIAWQHQASASATVRRLAHVLEGRSRIGLLRDGLGKLSLREILSVLSSRRGKPGLQALGSMADAVVDRLRPLNGADFDDAKT